MEEWKRRVDQWHQRREDAALRKKLALERQAEEQRLAEQLRLDTMRARLLKEHQKRFRCRVCGQPSNGPYRERKWEVADPGMPERWVDYENWDRPTGLSRCYACDRWACQDHVHRGVCAKCARRMR